MARQCVSLRTTRLTGVGDPLQDAEGDTARPGPRPQRLVCGARRHAAAARVARVLACVSVVEHGGAEAPEALEAPCTGCVLGDTLGGGTAPQGPSRNHVPPALVEGPDQDTTTTTNTPTRADWSSSPVSTDAR